MGPSKAQFGGGGWHNMVSSSSFCSVSLQKLSSIPWLTEIPRSTTSRASGSRRIRTSNTARSDHAADESYRFSPHGRHQGVFIFLRRICSGCLFCFSLWESFGKRVCRRATEFTLSCFLKRFLEAIFGHDRASVVKKSPLMERKGELNLERGGGI